MSRASSGVLAALSLLSLHAHAAPPPPQGLELGARVAFQINDQGQGMLAGVQIGGRVVPHLSLGAYGDVTPLHDPITPKCGCGDAPQRPLRFGAFGDIHFLPRKVVDPWLRLAIGLERTNRTAPDGELDFGLDLRFRRFSAGPFVMWVVPFADEQPKRWFGAGVRAVVAF